LFFTILVLVYFDDVWVAILILKSRKFLKVIGGNFCVMGEERRVDGGTTDLEIILFSTLLNETKPNSRNSLEQIASEAASNSKSLRILAKAPGDEPAE
jgi:hypothetical protein